MIRLLALFLAAVFAQDAPYERPKPLKCDLKKITKEYWCQTCYAFPKADDLDKKNVHKNCKKECRKIEVCVKIIYKCGKCYSTWPKPGTCKTPKCGAKMEKSEDKARIVFKCTGNCAYMSEKAGKCSSQGCNKKGGRLSRACEKDGQAPHVKK